MQLSLIEPPIARRSDPDTSKRGALRKTESGSRDSDQRLLLSFYRRYPNSTAMEIAQLMVDRGIDWLSSYQVASKRTSDLAEKGEIRESGRRKCRKTGSEARTWRAKPAAGVEK